LRGIRSKAFFSHIKETAWRFNHRRDNTNQILLKKPPLYLNKVAKTIKLFQSYMNVICPFGFVTGCHAGDRILVGATLASMRHYCPNVPICLTVDGDFDVSDFERDYGVITLRISELPSPEMRQTLGRSFHSKQAAMWEGPFEFYVWMDSDAIVWGDFTNQIRTDLDFQILWSEISISPNERVIPPWLLHYYYDPNKLREHDPEFDWRGRAYFSAGVYAARRNAIDYKHYCRIKRIADSEPETFAWGDMGMLNYLVHSENQRGRLKVGMADLQHIWGHHGVAELEADCAGAGWRFPERINRPRIAHFCGQKPYLHMRHAYSRPFTIARLEHHRGKHGEAGAWLQLLKEELPIVAAKIHRRLAAINSA
jgi:hypothetical protein